MNTSLPVSRLNSATISPASRNNTLDHSRGIIGATGVSGTVSGVTFIVPPKITVVQGTTNITNDGELIKPILNVGAVAKFPLHLENIVVVGHQ